MVLPVLFLVIGVVAFGFIIREMAYQRRLSQEGVRTEGVVVRHVGRSVTEGTIHFAVVDFVDAQGISHEFQSRIGGTRSLPLGGRTPVIYLPDTPANARVDIPAKRRVALVVQVLSAAGFFVVAIAMLRGH